MKKNVRGIHILLSAANTGYYTPFDLAEIAARGGASVVQLREKEMPMNELLPIAKRMREICRDITFIVNDHVDLAKIIEADGVHLGQDDMPVRSAKKILGEQAISGVSCGNIEEAKQAEVEGADYIGFGHMFPTSSKIKTTPQRTLKELEEVCSSLNVPVIAIGGITIKSAVQVVEAGTGGIAILSAFSGATNPEEMLRSLRIISGF